MTERRKRKLRRDRITDLSELGLESGKLYTFQGRFRYLYKDQKPVWQEVHTKIRTGDHVMFFKADLWQSTATKKKIVSPSSATRTMMKLKKDGFDVLGKKRHGWRRNRVQIEYKHKEPIYSGMMYIGYEDKFGWINIVQMSKTSVLDQFNKVELNHG